MPASTASPRSNGFSGSFRPTPACARPRAATPFPFTVGDFDGDPRCPFCSGTTPDRGVLREGGVAELRLACVNAKRPAGMVPGRPVRRANPWMIVTRLYQVEPRKRPPIPSGAVHALLSRHRRRPCRAAVDASKHAAVPHGAEHLSGISGIHDHVEDVPDGRKTGVRFRPCLAAVRAPPQDEPVAVGRVEEARDEGRRRCRQHLKQLHTGWRLEILPCQAAVHALLDQAPLVMKRPPIDQDIGCLGVVRIERRW